MAGGVLRGIDVVQIANAVVPIGFSRLARIGARHEGLLAANFELGLKRVGRIRQAMLRRWFALVQQENGDSAGARRDVRQLGGFDRAFPHMDAQAAGIRHVVGLFRAKGKPQDELARRTLPNRRCFAFLVFGFHRRVVSPTRDDFKRLHVARHQDADADGRGKETASRRPPLFRRLFRQPARGGRFVQLFLFVRIRVLLWRRTRRHEKSRQIPVRRSHPAGNPLFGELVIGGRADEVHVERVGEVGADLCGVGWMRHDELSTNGLDPAMPSQSIADAVHVWDVYAPVAQPLEYA